VEALRGRSWCKRLLTTWLCSFGKIQFAAQPVIYPCEDLECVVDYGGDLLSDVVGRAQIFSEEAHLAFEILL
jgi:hypothetical protein